MGSHDAEQDGAPNATPDGSGNEELVEDVTELAEGIFDGSADSAAAGWSSTGGSGAVSGGWTISYPSEWDYEEPNPGFVLFSGPDAPDALGVITRPYTGPLTTESARDIDELLPSLPAGEVISADPVDFAGRDAIHAELRYTNPTGRLARVGLTWIHDGDTLYLIAGEAPIDAPELQARVDQALESFTITSSA